MHYSLISPSIMIDLKSIKIVYSYETTQIFLCIKLKHPH